MTESWMVVNIGCIECGVGSNVVGAYATEAEAKRVAAHLQNVLGWREGGQNSFEVFPVPVVGGAPPDEYREALASLPSEAA